MTMWIQLLVNGLFMGGIYALVATGLTLIFGVQKVVNFAHGAFLMMAAYVSFWLWEYTGTDPYLSILLNVVLFFVLGVLVSKFLIGPVLDTPMAMAPMLISVGLIILLENTALFLWKPDYRSVVVSYQEASVWIGGVSLSVTRLVSFGVSILVTIALLAFLKKTDMGKAIRAVAEDREAAMLMGLNLKRIDQLTFGIGLACAGIAGSVITPILFVNPQMGEYFLTMIFSVVIVAGMGKIGGAFIVALVLGVAESIGSQFMPGSTRQVFPFILLIITLLFRPTGLFAGD